jgi:hypothetical protein
MQSRATCNNVTSARTRQPPRATTVVCIQGGLATTSVISTEWGAFVARHRTLLASVLLPLWAGCGAPAPGDPEPQGVVEAAYDRGPAGGNQASDGGEMRVEGRQLLDSSGAPFLARGIEGWFGSNAQANMPTLVDAIASQGFNAVRLQLLTTELSSIEPLIQRFHAKGMVVYLTDANMPAAREWFGLAGTRAMLERNKRNLVIDATIEEPGDAENPAAVRAWLATQKEVITKFRGWGYTEPLTIGTPNAGRYLKGLLDHGQELLDHDPLHSLVLNCQMYWGEYPGRFSYQGLSGFSAGDIGVQRAAAAVAGKSFPIQFGLDAADSGGNFAAVPYELLMIEAQAHGIGTMFWQWKDPGEDDPNSLVTDQLDPTTLTPLGEIVINESPASIKKTSRLVEP